MIIEAKDLKIGDVIIKKNLLLTVVKIDSITEKAITFRTMKKGYEHSFFNRCRLSTKVRIIG